MKPHFLATLALALVSGAFLWNYAIADKATQENLGGADRYLTAVSTDKPIYKPGEKVYVRGVLLHAVSHKPLPDNQQSNATIEIKGPKGDSVASGNTQTQDSVWGFAWDIPKDLPGGEYTCKVTYPWNGHAPAERKFDVRAYRAPRLRSQIVFLRDGYGPGEQVTATLHTERSEGGAPDGAKVGVIARVDGTEIRGADGKVDNMGNCSVSFELPKEIARGEGTLALVIEDGGVVETASKTIPILLQTIDINFYPEGGDLVAGLPNRVYFEARQTNGKPADLSGFIVDAEGNELAAAKSEHEGRGRFEFKPEANKKYALKVYQPAGIKKTFALPEVKATGVVIRTEKNVFGPGEPLLLTVTPPIQRAKVSVCKREEEVGGKIFELARTPGGDGPEDLSKVSIHLPNTVDGVLRVTVYDEKGTPLAERLVYREPAKKINMSIKTNKMCLVPGDSIEMTVKTTDEEGKPVPAVVGLTVTDDSILEMVEKREQAPRLPVMMLLEPEVKDLADAHVYLDKDNPKAALATDLLLGTQGWRRFAFMDVEKFLREGGDNARRVMAHRIQSIVERRKAGALMDGGAEGGVNFGMVPPAPMAGAPAPQGQNRGADPGAPHAGDDRAAAKPHAAPAKDAIEEKEALKRPAEPLAANGKAEAANQPVAADRAARAAEPMAKRKALVEQQLQQAERPKQQEALQDAAKKMDEKVIGARRALRAREVQMVIVREFAHQVRANRQPTDRVDFAETLFWNTGVRTNAEGIAKVSFGLNDSVTTFRVFADAFSSEGVLGTANVGLESVQPFYVEPKLPLEVTAGDTVLLPINVVNSIDSGIAGAKVHFQTKGEVKFAPLPDFDIDGMKRTRKIVKLDIGYGNSLEDFVITAEGGPFVDKVTRKLSIKPKGFPIERPFGGMLSGPKPATHSLTIPDTIVPRSLTTNVAVYPTPLANMTEALQRLIQDPNGCFEQTSSTSYPLTMAQQYFLSHTGVDPQLVERSRQKLDAGYRRLVSFWCPDRGYEWFGQNPGHEALTAFGVLHFTDMAQVREVDQNMITSTRSWLMKQRDGKGGFERKRRALHTWIEDKDCSNAYILWALLESGEKPEGLKAEIDALKTAAAQSSNSYVLGLAANVFHLAGVVPASAPATPVAPASAPAGKQGDPATAGTEAGTTLSAATRSEYKAEATKLMEKLATKQNATGGVDGGTATIVGSGGEALQIETTALASMAWLRDANFAGSVEKSMKFLADSCKAGRYGSTQSTVLALRAIVTYDKQRAKPKAPGAVQVFVDGQGVGGWVKFDEKTQGAIKLPDVSELLTKGEHKIEVKMQDGSEMPYSVAVNYNAITPASSAECKLNIEVKLGVGRASLPAQADGKAGTEAGATIGEGAATEANVTVTNKTKDVVPTPVAIVGIPGGLEPRHDQLKELVKKGTIDAYEVIGREVVLYWRTLDKEAKIEIPISLIAAVPGTYTGPASRAYLYYNDEHKQWADGVKVTITPK
ncbi:MAG TPA: MG2 domain-containing protein [Planctomycetota bacterium]|jgi:hypothetical protein